MKKYNPKKEAFNGALLGLAVTGIVSTALAIAHPDFKQYSLEEIILCAALSLPITIPILSATLYARGYVKNLFHYNNAILYS